MLLNFRDRTPKHTDRGAIELLRQCNNVIFLSQVFDMATGLLLRNITADVPEFEVIGLSSSISLAVSVRAYNKKGSSEPLTLTSSLLKYPQRHTG
jgi:hypothetical protein